jgi:hypothetical protein
LPRFDWTNRTDEPTVGPTVDEVVTHIQCEIKELIQSKDPRLNRLRNNIYVVNANLTLEVTDNQGVAPTLSFIHPLTSTATRTEILGAQLTGQQHRTMNLAFTLDLDPDEINSDRAKECGHSGTGSGLRGRLGINEIVISGLNYVGSPDFIFPVPNPTDPQGKRLNSPAYWPVFGTTIDFTLVYGVGGGPTWSLSHFKGPAGNSNLINFTRTDKDTLVLSFASAGPRKRGAIAPFMRPQVPAGQADIEQAARAAQDNSTRMILQRLLPLQ